MGPIRLQLSKTCQPSRIRFTVNRAANDGRSTDNVRSELGIDQTNPWIAGHVVRSFTNLFREILIFELFFL